MKLIHTLLFLIREQKVNEDLALAHKCLKSLEKGTYKTVVVYNQGFFTNEMVEQFLQKYDLNCVVIGEGKNVGTVVGRQSCFNTIWEKFPETHFISEIHLDMVFTFNWEDALIKYLETNDEPMVSCGIVDQNGNLPFAENTVAEKTAKPFPQGDNEEDVDAYLLSLREEKVTHGFTNPCVHNSAILKVAGGYDARFLTGKQAYEDDSMLLGYYYYYGTKVNWKPKVNFNSVVFHSVAGQRLGMNDSVLVNYSGLLKQYGAMGLKHLSQLHKSQWHINFFSEQFKNC